MALTDGMSRASKRVLEKIGTVRNVKKGDTLCKEGEPSAELWEIRSGRVEISRSTADGEAQSVNVCSTGDVIGELGFMTGAPRAATATMITDGEVFCLTEKDLDRVLDPKTVALQDTQTRLCVAHLFLNLFRSARQIIVDTQQEMEMCLDRIARLTYQRNELIRDLEGHKEQLQLEKERGSLRFSRL